jgi:hypothetical protein
VADGGDIFKLLQITGEAVKGVSPIHQPLSPPTPFAVGVEVKDMSAGVWKESGRDSKDAGQVSGNHAFIPRAANGG